MTKTKTLRVDPGTECKLRVEAIRDDLPKNVRQLITERYRDYNTARGIQLINNVLNGRSADLRLTEILEKIAEEKGGKNRLQRPLLLPMAKALYLILPWRRRGKL